MKSDTHLDTYVEESYSREMDMRILKSEMPYGYDSPPPPYDTGDYNQRILESDKQYPVKKGRSSY